MKTRKYIRILCLLLCLAFLLVSCGDNDNDTSSEETESVESVVEPVSDTVSQSEPSEDPSEEPSEPDYQLEMTEEMARAYLKYKRIDDSLEDFLLFHEGGRDYNYKADYTAFGNLNGYTLCAVSNDFVAGFSSLIPYDCVAGDYTFLARVTGDEVDFCLYKDNEFISISDAYEQGLFDSKDAYELIRKNEQYKICAKKSSEIDYPVIITEEMANAYLKFRGEEITLQELLESRPKDYDYTHDYIACGKLKNGYTLCTFLRMFEGMSVDASMHYTVGDYVIRFNFTRYPSRVGFYLYKDNTFMTFEDADKQGLIDADEVYEILEATGIHPMVKLSDLPEDEAEYYRQNPVG